MSDRRRSRVEETDAVLSTLRDLDVLPRSPVSVAGAEIGLARPGPRVAILAPSGSAVMNGFQGESSARGDRTLLLGPTSTANLDALRALLPWLRPRPLGIRTSAGFGDRLGLATPGHVRALRAAGGGLSPIFAQQSIREMQRVLTPGGRLLSLDFNRPRNPIIRSAYLVYLSVVGSLLGLVLHGDPDTYRYIPESIRQYPGAEGVARLLQDGGFEGVRVIPVLGGLMAIHTATKSSVTARATAPSH